jgi:hypothetical protein
MNRITAGDSTPSTLTAATQRMVDRALRSGRQSRLAVGRAAAMIKEAERIIAENDERLWPDASLSDLEPLRYMLRHVADELTRIVPPVRDAR